jgi:molybdate transport system substrate-binding protein
MLKKLCAGFFALILCGSFAGHLAAGEPRSITVSAAISLQNAFEEIGRRFAARNKDVIVVFNFGASGRLMAQIKGGAPVDVFASAALKDLDELDKAGLVLEGTRVNFASNGIVLIAPASSKAIVASFEDLKKPAIQKIAIGNPRTVPAGRYADEVLHFYKLSDALKDKLVLGENVRQVLDYVARNEVDAGVVYATDARTRVNEVAVVAAAPKNYHKPVLYPIAVVKGSKNEKAARTFLSFVLSVAGRKVLEQYGFTAVK